MPSWKVSHRASMTNRPAWMTGGLGPSVGPGAWATRAIQINANGQGPFRFRTFCINQLGNIGGGVRNSMFGSSSDGTNGCRDQPNINPPYGINLGGLGGKSSQCIVAKPADSQHTLTIGSFTAQTGSLGELTYKGYSNISIANPTVSGLLSNPTVYGLTVVAAAYLDADQSYLIAFEFQPACICTPSDCAVLDAFFPQNISIEVINNQGLMAQATISGGGGPFGLGIVFGNLSQTFIDIVNGTDGPTYTLKIKQNP